MARVYRTNRRRANVRHRRRTASGRFAKSHHRTRHNRRMNAYHPRRRRRNRRYNVRHNRRMNRRRNIGGRLLSAGGVIGALEKGTYIAGGAVFSRWLTQMVLGSANTGAMGYVGNAVAGGVLSFVADGIRRGSGEYIIYGTAAGIVLRFIQDSTPLGKYFNLSGVDHGMGAIIPQNLPLPSIYTGQNAMVRVPGGWGPSAVPAGAAIPASAAGAVVKTGMGAPVGRGLYSTGGGRGLYRPA